MLKVRNDSAEFVPEFVNTYGYPMWKSAATFLKDDVQVYLVPVRSRNSNDEIKAVWFFLMSANHTHYFIYTREMADAVTRKVGDEMEQTWLFDYFTQKALHRRPASGLFFVDRVPESDTRTVIVWVGCSDAYAGYPGQEEYKRTLCVVTDVEYYPDPPRPDYGNREGQNGSTGDFDYGSGVGGSGGGGSGNSSNNNGDNGQDSPCSKAQSLSKDAAFRAKVNELFQEVHNEQPGFLEDGWAKTTTGDYIYPSIRGESEMKYTSSDFAGKKIVEQYHSHPSTGACYPSMPDLKSLAARYQNGNIDVNNFTYGVISVYGCLSIIITSETAFRTFANKLMNDDVALNDAYQTMHSFHSTTSNMSVAKFIDFLKSSVSGLDVMFNEPSFDSNGTPRLGDWTAKNSDGSAHLSDYKCN
ncbi:hypothetical protein AAE250_01845 [Bacteroides sp. GD17]|uniref:hypothetical protein n=1 Tax=Bacteroides sp. GD17 TaxID=3139826 RepID=UPI0025D5CF8F|nr:hypothetical protein [uncultured Bacteroides sp.]